MTHVFIQTLNKLRLLLLYYIETSLGLVRQIVALYRPKIAPRLGRLVFAQEMLELPIYLCHILQDHLHIKKQLSRPHTGGICMVSFLTVLPLEVIRHERDASIEPIDIFTSRRMFGG
jgi:hypothetical protein